MSARRPQASRDCSRNVSGHVDNIKNIGRISGPLLDRLDLHVDVPPVLYRDLASASREEASATIRARGNAARTIQQQRYAADGLFCNAHMRPKHLQAYCQLDAGGRQLLERAMARLGLSARGYDRVRKVARTIADLAGAASIGVEHLAEALQYRSLDRELWQ